MPSEGLAWIGGTRGGTSATPVPTQGHDRTREGFPVIIYCPGLPNRPCSRPLPDTLQLCPTCQQTAADEGVEYLLMPNE